MPNDRPSDKQHDTPHGTRSNPAPDWRSGPPESNDRHQWAWRFHIEMDYVDIRMVADNRGVDYDTSNTSPRRYRPELPAISCHRDIQPDIHE